MIRPTPAEPARRAILLGASNITLGLPWVVPAVEERLGAPVDIVGAWGHGRSYGEPSSLLFRTLRGIVHSKLWQVLEERPELPTSALVTDVGNDIAFGHEPKDILEWVTTIFERLDRIGARTVVTALPVERLRDQGRWNFLVFRLLYFPQYPLRQAEILAKVDEVSEGLTALVERFGFQFVHPERHWYGLDPIHIQFPQMSEAWERILRPWDEEERVLPKRWANPRRALELWSQRPERYDLFAEKYLTPQPCYRTRKRSPLSLF